MIIHYFLLSLPSSSGETNLDALMSSLITTIDNFQFHLHQEASKEVCLSALLQAMQCVYVEPNF